MSPLRILCVTGLSLSVAAIGSGCSPQATDSEVSVSSALATGDTLLATKNNDFSLAISSNEYALPLSGDKRRSYDTAGDTATVAATATRFYRDSAFFVPYFAKSGDKSAKDVDAFVSALSRFDGASEVLLMNGRTGRSTNVLPGVKIPNVWSIIAQCNFDGDSDNTNDILFRNQETGQLVVWYVDKYGKYMSGYFMKVGSASADPFEVPIGNGRHKPSSGGYFFPIACGKFGNSKSASLLWRQRGTSRLVMWGMGQGGLVTEGKVISLPDPSAAGGRREIPVPPTWNVTDVADVDGDGVEEILWAQNESTDAGGMHVNRAEVVIWKMRENQYESGVLAPDAFIPRAPLTNPRVSNLGGRLPFANVVPVFGASNGGRPIDSVRLVPKVNFGAGGDVDCSNFKTEHTCRMPMGVIPLSRVTFGRMKSNDPYLAK